MVAVMWRVSPAFPAGILSVIGFSGSGLVFLPLVSNTNNIMYSYATKATRDGQNNLLSFYCDKCTVQNHKFSEYNSLNLVSSLCM